MSQISEVFNMIGDLKETIEMYKDFAECETATARVLRKVGNENEARDYEVTAENDKRIVALLTELQERREADRWIPVSEKLPEDRDWYLGVFKEPSTDFIGIPYICDYVGEITKGTTNEGWILRNCTDVDNAPDYFRNLICIAWKPLPKPYESEYERLLKELEEEAWKDQMYQDGIEAMASEEDP